jgi:hypothetical protein
VGNFTVYNYHDDNAASLRGCSADNDQCDSCGSCGGASGCIGCDGNHVLAERDCADVCDGAGEYHYDV